MRFITKQFGLVVLVGCLMVVWRADTDHDVAIAQGRRPVVITRIFTGPDGLAHAEDIELTLNARGATEMLKATGTEFSVRPPTAGASRATPAPRILTTQGGTGGRRGNS
jgi:hypothetical protein